MFMLCTTSAAKRAANEWNLLDGKVSIQMRIKTDLKGSSDERLRQST